ncbi:MAG: hypothetical protein HDS93_05155 [Bacteroidales bacterium]|nr:hypothetical protein [Bacteroidales bacterium]MBD5209473.1 hypothetical protein [Bacteroidales bacterium]MDE6083746.1 hypothetical protein [Muribaculaceae bacterium]
MRIIEKEIHDDLRRYLTDKGLLDERLPECPDVEELWPAVRDAYLEDGVREFNEYPVVSLGWIMFVGMALAKCWDTDWEEYSKAGGAQLYTTMRDERGYDNLDDFILESVLGLDKEEAEKTSAIVGECAARVFHKLQTCGLEPGTEDAARAYLDALHQLYLMGIYTELNALGYHMTKM